MTPEEKIAKLRDALEKNVRRCEWRNGDYVRCNKIATYEDQHFEPYSYYCDEHVAIEEDRRENGTGFMYCEELPASRLAIAVLAKTA